MDEEISKLVEGFGRFQQKHFKDGAGLYERLIREGQSPRIMVVACCDSRVDPAIITDCDPGDLFVVRNVANLVPPCETAGHYHGTSAALEFAVSGIGVQHIIVLGHSRCGGIRALMGDTPQPAGVGQFISPWVAIAEEARSRVLASGKPMSGDEAARACEQAAIGVSLKNLMSFDWIRKRVASQSLQLHGWYFDIDNGALLRYDPGHGTFEPLR